jgi:hypothetical protein
MNCSRRRAGRSFRAIVTIRTLLLNLRPRIVSSARICSSIGAAERETAWNSARNGRETAMRRIDMGW